MSKCWLLIRVFFKTNKQKLSNKKGKTYDWLLYLVIAFSLIPFVKVVCDGTSQFYKQLSIINEQGVILGIGFSLTCLFILFFGFAYCINVLYLTSDLEYILPLPFKPWEIVTAKFTTILVYEYIIAAMFLAPIIITYGIESSAGVLFYIYGTLIFLSIPIIPLCISGVLVILLMSFTKFSKNKDKFSKIIGVAGIFVMIILNSYMQNIGSKSMTPEKMQKMFLDGNNGFVNIVSKIFPSSKFAALSCIQSQNITGLLNFIIFLAITVLSFIIFNIIAQKFYLIGASSASKTFSKRKKLTNVQLEKNSKKQYVVLTYAKNELKILFRTPTYFYNCIIMNFLWPLFLIIPLLMNGDVNFDTMFKIGSIKGIDSTIILIGFSMMIFVNSANGIASTAISRLGKSAYFTKYIPISYEKQLIAKLLPGIFIGFISEILFIIIGGVLFKINAKCILIIGILSILAIIFTNVIGILIDLYHPKLNWDNEQQAIKQNINLFLEMILSWGAIGILIFISVNYKMSVLYISLLILISFSIIDFILLRVLKTKGAKRFANLE